MQPFEKAVRRLAQGYNCACNHQAALCRAAEELAGMCVGIRFAEFYTILAMYIEYVVQQLELGR